MVFALFKLVCGLWFPVLQNQSAEMLPKSSLLGNLLLQSQDLRVTFFNFHRGKRLRFRPSSAFFLGRDVLWRFSWKYLAMLKLWIWLNLYVPNIYICIYIPYTSKDHGPKDPIKLRSFNHPKILGSLEVQQIGTNHANHVLEGWFNVTCTQNMHKPQGKPRVGCCTMGLDDIKHGRPTHKKLQILKVQNSRVFHGFLGSCHVFFVFLSRFFEVVSRFLTVFHARFFWCLQWI